MAAFLDGRRLKGYIYNFSAQKERFRLFPEESSRQTQGMDIEMKDLKALFFVKDFVGDREYRESATRELPKQGRKTEVTFSDGETLIGTTDAYNPKKLGFFVIPADLKCNNLRVFVLLKNARQIRWL